MKLIVYWFLNEKVFSKYKIYVILKIYIYFVCYFDFSNN